jgi:hypothetical protein
VHLHVFCCDQFERMRGASISRGQDLGGEVQLRDWLRGYVAARDLVHWTP